MLKRGDVLILVRAVAKTHETEIGCDECFEQLDLFAETEILRRGGECCDAAGWRSPRQVRRLS